MENTTPHYDFDDPENFPNHLFLRGKCDQIVTKLAKDCGWAEEFAKMMPEYTKHKKTPSLSVNKAKGYKIGKTTDEVIKKLNGKQYWGADHNDSDEIDELEDSMKKLDIQNDGGMNKAD